MPGLQTIRCGFVQCITLLKCRTCLLHICMFFRNQHFMSKLQNMRAYDLAKNKVYLIKKLYICIVLSTVCLLGHKIIREKCNRLQVMAGL